MRLRLTIFGAVVTVISMVAFSALIIALAEQAAPEDLDKQLVALADATAAALDAAPPDDFPLTPPIGAVELTGAAEPFVAILRPDGTVIHTTGVVDGAPPDVPAAVVVEAIDTGASTATMRVGADVPIRLHATRWDGPGGPLVVIAGQPEASLAGDLRGLQAVIAVATVITVIAATFVAWLVAGRALRPLRQLAATTDEIGATGDLTRRLPSRRSRDEVGRLTRSFNAMLDRLATTRTELERALENQRRFVADASHELRTPLTTIRNNAGFLAERPDVDPADRAEAIRDIRSEADRMAKLVDQLLHLARFDAESTRASVPIDVGALVAEVAATAGRSGIPVEATAPSSPVVVVGDEAELTRLLWILIDNARHHGAPPIEIGVSGSPPELWVRDHGPGVPEADRERIFERFHRADPSRSGPGSGLGLAIAREIVTRHGLDIRVEDAGPGARFVVRLDGPERDASAGD